MEVARCPQGTPHTPGRDTALGLAELLWDGDVPITQLRSTMTYPEPLSAFPVPCPQRPWPSQALGSRAAPKARFPPGSRCWRSLRRDGALLMYGASNTGPVIDGSHTSPNAVAPVMCYCNPSLA